MVLLTTMLVIAITMQSIQGVSMKHELILYFVIMTIMPMITFLQNLPRTPYYKLVDIWMMFSLTILLYALVCNTIIGCLLQKAHASKKEKQNTDRIQAVFKVRSISNSKILDLESTHNNSSDYEQLACTFNMIAKWFFAISVVIFNAAFWIYSINQYIN